MLLSLSYTNIGMKKYKQLFTSLPPAVVTELLLGSKETTLSLIQTHCEGKTLDVGRCDCDNDLMPAPTSVHMGWYE